MKKLPNAVKWLIILVVLGAMGAMMWAVNDRASRVEMPARTTPLASTIQQRAEHNKAPAVSRLEELENCRCFFCVTGGIHLPSKSST